MRACMCACVLAWKQGHQRRRLGLREFRINLLVMIETVRGEHGGEKKDCEKFKHIQLY